MFSKLELALKYIHYYLTASNGKGHGIHSPFIFQFITEILNDKTQYPAYDVVEDLRRKLLKDQTILTINDLGAGSAVDKTHQRTIASIVSHAVKQKKFGQVLFRMVKKYQPQTILELGTSLGVTTAYFSLANPAATIFTFEGAKSVAEKAKDNFNSLALQNIRLVQGNFNETLGATISSLPSVDLAFIDGNHRKEPTINYFMAILPKTNNFSVLILDDIHWSEEMEEAWNYCKEHQAVTLSIDLFFMGILFFRKEVREKQHFHIRF
ncbi:MAG TPA: class I SAM-dependent methyltransferase [Chitinophagaceae bacterium]|nr:class I SAM-dependent methyltransferase [Chitinophagaceae bacterium]